MADNDGLAPGESTFSLSQACMAAQGYPSVNAGLVPFGIRVGGPGGLAFSQPWGGWGYLGAAQASQSGFRLDPGAGLSQLGVDIQPVAIPSLPAAEQTAVGKCATIVSDFGNAAQNGPLAGITTLADDISNDVAKDPAVRGATRIWAACMARNGYHFGQPTAVFNQEMQTMYGGGPINFSAVPSPSAERAQIAAAVTDAACTRSSDLGGIYFAVQASYEQQLVSANQQALTADVRRYRAAYSRELRKLRVLLRTAKAQPFNARRARVSPAPSRSA